MKITQLKEPSEAWEHFYDFCVKSKPYDFQIDSSKFIETYDFNFQETVETITLSLKNNFDKCIKFSRHYEVKYP